MNNKHSVAFIFVTSEGTMSILQQKKFWLVGLLIGAALVLSGCGAMPWAAAQAEPTPLPTITSNGVVSAEGRVIPLRSIKLGFQVGGELGEILVSEGDEVAQGDVLARLTKREPLEAQLRQANLELLSAQQALDELLETEELAREQAYQELVAAQTALNEARKVLHDLDTDEFQEELDDLNIAVQDAKEELDDAKEELDKYLDLDPDNATRKNAQTAYDDALRAYNKAVYDRDEHRHELDQAKAAVALAEARVAEAQRQYDNRADGVDADALALAQARVDMAAAQVSAAQRALDNTELVAPFAGTVVDLNDLEPGETVNPGQTVVTLADMSGWLVETRDLTELDVVSVRVGQEVTVTPDALPEVELTGTVDSIAQVFSERSGDVVYTVRIRLNERDARLRWGMTVEVVFDS